MRAWRDVRARGAYDLVGAYARAWWGRTYARAPGGLPGSGRFYAAFAAAARNPSSLTPRRQ